MRIFVFMISILHQKILHPAQADGFCLRDGFYGCEGTLWLWQLVTRKTWIGAGFSSRWEVWGAQAGTGLERQQRIPHLDFQAAGREGDTGPGLNFWKLKAHPQWHAYPNKGTPNPIRPHLQWYHSLWVYGGYFRSNHHRLLTSTNVGGLGNQCWLSLETRHLGRRLSCKCLANTNEDLSSDLQHSHKKPVIKVGACNPSTGRSLGTCLVVSRTESLRSRINVRERDLVSKPRRSSN